MPYNVLVSDNVHASALEILHHAAGIAVTAPGQMSRVDALAAVPEADALIIRSATKVDAEMIATSRRLKAIARAGVGVDNVDVDAATARGIVVMNTPEGNTIATAEHAFGLMLALARYIPAAHLSMLNGKWDRKSYMGVELRGKTLGVVGFGRVGSAVARRALAFDMRVIAYDPHVPADVVFGLGVEMVPLDDLYSRADFITLHSTINDATRGMIHASSLSQMKRGVRIINAARGALIDEAALADAIRSGHVAGAALDVYASEPPGADHPLVGLPGVVHTPHLAASTEDAQVAVAVEAAKLVVNALVNGEYKNVVNPAVLSAR